jgi:glucose/arabinose dehydrogenase
MKKLLLISILLACYVFSPAQVMNVTTLSTGFTRPVCIQNTGLANDDRLFILEKVGRIRIINRLTGAVTATPFLNITSIVNSSGNEEGLLGLAFHPDFANNGYFYVYHTITGGNNVIARYQVSAFPDTAMVNSRVVLMSIYHRDWTNHNGGNLMFGKDGYLYISVGDGGNGGDQGTGHNATYGNAQHIDSVLGKILRLDVNNPNPPYYFSPATNPFFGGNAPSTIPWAGTLPGRSEIFEWGMRNPWKCSIDRLTGDKWIGDVGQNLWEEIDFEGRCDSLGKNYGWRCYEGNVAYNTSNCQPQSSYTSPIYVYAHTGGNCAVTGGYVYRGGLEGGMFGKYFFTDYCTGLIWATAPNGTGGWTTTQLTQTSTVHTFEYNSWGEDIYGEIYLAGETGAIYRVRDTACAPVAYIYSKDTVYNCLPTVNVSAIYGQGLTYTWSVIGIGWGIASGQGTNAVTLNTTSASALVSVSVSNGTCSASSNTIRFITSVTYSGLPDSICTNSAPVTLVGSPAGGTFNGPGVAGGSFNPVTAGSGTHAIVYTLNDNVSTCYFAASNCVLTDTQYVIVHSAPSVSITGADTLYCVYNPSTTFTGNPSGGTFSGPGMTGNTFDPSAAGLGFHTVTYSYTDTVTGCSDSMSVVIHVDACLSVSDHSSLISLSLFPNPNTGSFMLNVNLRNGETLKAEITDMLGKVVFQKTISLNAGRNSVPVNEALAKGSYKLKLSNDNVNEIRSFIVK